MVAVGDHLLELGCGLGGGCLGLGVLHAADTLLAGAFQIVQVADGGIGIGHVTHYGAVRLLAVHDTDVDAVGDSHV